MTANSTPESHDAVVAEMQVFAEPDASGPMVYDHAIRLFADRLQSAHARELTEQQATHAADTELSEKRRLVLIEMTEERTRQRKRAEAAEARADAAMGLLQKAQPFVATCPDLCQPGGDELRETIDAFLAQQALAGGERKDG